VQRRCVIAIEVALGDALPVPHDENTLDVARRVALQIGKETIERRCLSMRRLRTGHTAEK